MARSPVVRRDLIALVIAVVVALVWVGWQCLPFGGATDDDGGDSTGGPSIGATVVAIDPDRPYGWAAGDPYAEGYAVAFVRGMDAAQALRALGPVRRDAGPLDGRAAWELSTGDEGDTDPLFVVSLAERAEGDGVVITSPNGYFTDAQVQALSRQGVAAAYSNTISGDHHTAAARQGRLLWQKDDDLSGPAAWAVLDEVTSISVSEDWLVGKPHPTYVLADR